MPLLLAAWLAATVGIIVGWARPWPALVNLLLCRYFFVHMRWKGVLRGMGAPGFVAYWLGGAVLLLDIATMAAPAQRPLALLVIQVDFALIMLSAGVYKLTAGYAHNHGMELGLCNPMWGYWWRRYVTLPPDHALFRWLNHLAWSTEIASAVLMLIPGTRQIGGLLLSVSFVFILTQIRLGFLCEMVVIAGLLYVTPGGLVDGWIRQLIGSSPEMPSGTTIGGVVPVLLSAALWLYLVLLPCAHAGVYYNFYARRRLPAPLQWALERYTNFFGIIIWRVFSVDLVNFFIRVYAQSDDGVRTLVGRFGSWPRFNHVGEMICLTSLFTTLKYYSSNTEVFRERLVRYARTVPVPAGGSPLFEYVSVIKRPSHFDWVPVAEYRVDVHAGVVNERILEPSFSPRAAHAVSPVHEGTTPGSYAPAER